MKLSPRLPIVSLLAVIELAKTSPPSIFVRSEPCRQSASVVDPDTRICPGVILVVPALMVAAGSPVACAFWRTVSIVTPVLPIVMLPGRLVPVLILSPVIVPARIASAVTAPVAMASAVTASAAIFSATIDPAASAAVLTEPAASLGVEIAPSVICVDVIWPVSLAALIAARSASDSCAGAAEAIMLSALSLPEVSTAVSQ